jgi:hypothetical protein
MFPCTYTTNPFLVLHLLFYIHPLIIIKKTLIVVIRDDISTYVYSTSRDIILSSRTLYISVVIVYNVIN